jgi:hypothetical protein
LLLGLKPVSEERFLLLARRTIERIREKIRRHEYDMSQHATEEMAEDVLNIDDVESAVLTGQITRIERDDPRGTTYVIEGTAADQKTPVGIIGRFAGSGRYLMITVYEVREEE